MRTALLAVLLCFPAYAAEPLKADVMCDGKGWCAIRYDTLKALLEGAQKLQAHNAYIETLCNWRKP